MIKKNDGMHSDSAFALFDNNYKKDAPSFLFEGLERLVEVPLGGDVTSALTKMEEGLDQGLYAAGFLSYEAANGLSLKLPIHDAAGTAGHQLPVLQFGLFKHKHDLTNDQVESYLKNKKQSNDYSLKGGELEQSQATYEAALLKVQEHIEAGDTYQLNYTSRYGFSHEGDRIAFYEDLRNKQPVQYGALLQMGEVELFSRSPELFFKKQSKQLTVKPMKGTALRGSSAPEDAAQKQFLKSDDKNRSENIIIVDLLRNDLGRIADTGTVHVEKLLEVETYETVHQMTSTIGCEIDHNISLEKLFSNIFPCGSITGAPKKRTMEIIADLENSPRGIYTGSMGYILPNRDMCFNVAIRTIEMQANGECRMGLGGGITIQSDPSDEYQECLNKGKFLFQLMADKLEQVS